MGFFDRPLFDFIGDGKADAFETYAGLQMMAGSRQEAIALTGDDTFYTGSDDLEADDELVEELEMAGLDVDELEYMDEDERREAIADAGLDPDDYGDEFQVDMKEMGCNYVIQHAINSKNCRILMGILTDRSIPDKYRGRALFHFRVQYVALDR